MISFSCRKATVDDIDYKGAWQLPALSFCEATDKANEINYLLLYANDSLCGLCCYCQKAGTEAISTHVKEPLTLCFHLHLFTDISNKHHSQAIEFALPQPRERFRPSHFVVNVYADQLVLLNVYKRIGFAIHSFSNHHYTLALDERPFVDASMALQNSMAQYEGDPPFRRSLVAHEENGGYTVSLLSMCAHTGTHIDTPAHVGQSQSEDIDFLMLNGSVQLIDWSIPSFDMVLSNRILLQNTRRGLTFQEAERFVAAGISFIGMDRLSVGFDRDEWIVHKILLQNGVLILENAVLHHLSPGFYQMRCLPLSIPGSDGLPVRLLLREEISQL